MTDEPRPDETRLSPEDEARGASPPRGRRRPGARRHPRWWHGSTTCSPTSSPQRDAARASARPRDDQQGARSRPSPPSAARRRRWPAALLAARPWSGRSATASGRSSTGTWQAATTPVPPRAAADSADAQAERGRDRAATASAAMPRDGRLDSADQRISRLVRRLRRRPTTAPSAPRSWPAVRPTRSTGPRRASARRRRRRRSAMRRTSDAAPSRPRPTVTGGFVASVTTASVATMVVTPRCATGAVDRRGVQLRRHDLAPARRAVDVG